MQATSGYLSVNYGSTSPLHLCDLSSGMVAGQALLAALYAREQTGEGCYIDTSMFDCFVWWNSLLDSRWCFNGGECKRNDLEYPSTAYNVYETADGGKLALGMVEPKFWEPFCDAIGHPEIKRNWLDASNGKLLKRSKSFVKPLSLKLLRNGLIGSRIKTSALLKLIPRPRLLNRLRARIQKLLLGLISLAWAAFSRLALPHHLSTIPVEIAEFEEATFTPWCRYRGVPQEGWR